MTDAGFFRGTSAEQDNRFSDKEKKLMKQMKFGNNLSKKVDMNRVKLDILKPWITQRITEMLGMEDDVVIEFVFNQLEEKDPDPRKMQINLTGFLNGKNARIFMQELWDLLVSASENPSGIPQCMVERKKEEILRRKKEQQLFDTRLNSESDRAGGQMDDQAVDTRASRHCRSRSRSPSAERRSTRRRSRSPSAERRSTRRRSRSPSAERRSSRRRSRSRSPSAERRSSRRRSRSRTPSAEHRFSRRRSPDTGAGEPSNTGITCAQSTAQPHSQHVQTVDTASELTLPTTRFSEARLNNGARLKRSTRWDDNTQSVDTISVSVRPEEKPALSESEDFSAESKKTTHSKRNYRSNKEDDLQVKSHKVGDGQQRRSNRRSEERERHRHSDQRPRHHEDRDRSQRYRRSPLADANSQDRHGSRSSKKSDHQLKRKEHRLSELNEEFDSKSNRRYSKRRSSRERSNRRASRPEREESRRKRVRRESSSETSSTSTGSEDASESTEDEREAAGKRKSSGGHRRKSKRRESVSSSSGSSEDSSDESTDGSGTASSGDDSDSSERSVSSLEHDLDKLEKKLRAKALQSMFRAEQEATARNGSSSGQ